MVGATDAYRCCTPYGMLHPSHSNLSAVYTGVATSYSLVALPIQHEGVDHIVSAALGWS